MGAGTRLKQLLEEKNVTIKELSLMSGVSINTLYGITKRDNITIKNEILTPIADVLGVPPQYILGLDGEALIWTDDDIRLFRDDDFIDSKDGLLGEIIKIFNNLTLEGKLKCLEFSKDLEKIS